MREMKNVKVRIIAAIVSVCLVLSLSSKNATSESANSSPVNLDHTAFQAETEQSDLSSELAQVSVYSGQPYVTIHNNIPYFSESDLTTESFESYSELDILGRCGVAYASIGTDIMPTEERGSIGQIKPTGWHTVKYNDIIDGNYLYNRCHLIGYQLSGENANEKNLITGTRYLNVVGMQPFENKVADYVIKTENHVLYRVTPIFEGDNLLASGVLIEAESVEDNGNGILFCVYVYNAQPGIIIDYASGESFLDEDIRIAQQEIGQSECEPTPESQGTTYILNTNTRKFHYPYCSSVDEMKDKNKQVFTGYREEVILQGYVPCKRCNP